MATVASDLSAAILRSKNIEAPVLYRGIVHSFNPVNNLELKVLRVFPSTCSANPKTKSLKAPMLIGSVVPLVTAGHARSTVRILIRFFGSKVQKAGNSTGHELFLNAAIQRIADFVVYQMGGLVGDTDEMLKRCRVTSNELRNSLNTVKLPIGRVDVGLSRHRSLLFKVLADRINLPCMLGKGSIYTGTDDGAVHWIKIDDGSEYIIGLTSTSGTLIPAEVHRSPLLDSTLGAGGFSGSSGSINRLSLVLHQVAMPQDVLPEVDEIPKAHRSRLEEAIPVDFQPKHHSEHKFEKLVPSEYMPAEASPFSVEGSWLAQEYKSTKQAVLLESGASPPPDSNNYWPHNELLIIHYVLNQKIERLGLAAIEANSESPNESPGATILPGITKASEADTPETGGDSSQKISEEYPLPTVIDSSNERRASLHRNDNTDNLRCQDNKPN
ncbi:hypothetical protein Nepgr_031160 [Nepenthes gracilis]|uniref:EDR1/CTR1/ARMC3-like peptidase-like domain-containing protein n=1 Tax=Nepenthes gracilis TaxID=150966 RepID=A0AAD3TH06_NEPGR|nr:hypothetical protein Nepgr_031160 [Nepenthes gracilis]